MKQLLLTISLLFALNCVFAAQQIPLKNYNTGSGLISNFIFDLRQDDNGFIWIATDRGLSRFDGKSFTNFTKADGLSDNFIYTIFSSSDGSLWFGTYQGGITRMNAEGFLIISEDDGLLSNGVLHISEDKFGRMYFMTEKGLTIWRDSVIATFPNKSGESDNLFIHPTGRVFFNIDNKLFFIDPVEENVFTRHEFLSDELSATTFSLRSWASPLLRNNGTLIFPSRNNYLEIKLEENGEPKDVKVIDIPIFALTEDHFGRLWTAERDQVHVFSENDDFYITGNQGLNPAYVEAILEDKEGNIWLGSFGGGLYKYKGDYLKYFTEKDGLLSNHINVIYQDKNGMAYIGAPKGISLIDKQNIVTALRINPELIDITAIIKDQYQNLYAGNFKTIIGPIAKGKILSLSNNIIISSGVSSIYTSDDGAVWVGSYGDGLYKFKDNERTIFTKDDGLPTNVIEKIIPGVGGFWLITKDRGAVKVVDEKFRFFSQRIKTVPKTIHTLFEEPDGSVWFGTDRGAALLNNGECEMFLNDAGLIGNYVLGIFHFGSQTVFVTEKALHYLENGRFKVFLGPEMFSEKNVVIHGIYYSKESAILWLATNRGVVRIDMKMAEKQNNWLADKSPNVVINSIKSDTSVIFTNSYFNGQVLENNVELRSSENNIQFDFSGISFRSEFPLQFIYKLEGGEEIWSSPSQIPLVTYRNLSSGEYTFYVHAINSAGVKSKTPALFSFVILPPFYLKLWFLLPFSIFIIGLLTGSIYFVSTLKLKRNIKKLEREKAFRDVREKTRRRIAGELHDDVASTLSSINLYTESLSRRIRKEPGKLEEYLTKLKDLTHNAQNTMEEVVWSLTPRHDSVRDLTNRITDAASELCFDNELICGIETMESENDYPVDETNRKNIYLIFKESMNNILKHSKAAEVAIRVGIKENYFILEISDNGKGFDPSIQREKTRGGNGLDNMKKRAKHINAEFLIIPEPGNGVKIIFKKEMTQMSY